MMEDKLKLDVSDKMAVLVLGMHRSGTSSLAGLLDGLGCKGPATLMPASKTNALGYFESLQVSRINEAILESIGSRWSDWRQPRPDWYLTSRLKAFHDKALQIVSEEFGSASMIYLKDPRICLLLPLWQEVLASAGYSCFHLHIHRNPIEVVASLKARDGIDPAFGLLCWLVHVLQAERHSRGKKRFFTSYEALLNDPVAVTDAAEAAFGFFWPKRNMAGLGLIDPTLRHHDCSLDHTLDKADVSNLIRGTLAIMESWSIKGEQPADHARLDQITADLEQADQLFAAPVRTLEAQAGELVPCLARETALKRERDELEANLSRLDIEKNELERKLVKADSACNEALQQKEALLQTGHQHYREEIDALKKQIQEVRKEYLTSTSWRISSPVRLAKRLILRLRGHPI